MIQLILASFFASRFYKFIHIERKRNSIEKRPRTNGAYFTQVCFREYIASMSHRVCLRHTFPMYVFGNNLQV